jgi:hypothetical protein
MRILVLTAPNSGVGYHRLMLPIYYLEKTYAMFTDALTDEVLEENFNLVIFNRFIPGTTLETLIEKRDKYGFKIICDIDDYWILDSSHILASVYPTKEIINHIKIADLVTCTNEKLWNEIRPLNSNVAILPNALPYGNDQFTDVREYTDKIKFVYTGSITHEEDIKIIQFPFKKVASDNSLRNKVHFQLCGFDDRGEGSAHIWHRMISNFTCGLKLGDVKRFLPVSEYMNFYNDADCSIVPLRATRFNSMKSNLKLLEAATKKIPVIGSHVEPYLNSPMIDINYQSDWYKEIKKVTEDAIYRKDKGLELFEWAVTNFSLFKVNEKRKQLYASI